MRVMTSEYEISGKLITFARSKRFPPEHNLPQRKNSMEQAAFRHEVKVVCSLPIPLFTLFCILMLSSQAFFPNMEDRPRVSSNEFCWNHRMNIARIIKWILLELWNEYCLNCLSLQWSKRKRGKTSIVIVTFIVCKWVLWWERGLVLAMIEMTRHVLITFLISGNDVISLESRPLNFLVIIHASV